MTSRLVAVCFAATDPQRLARFWSGLLGWEPAGDGTVVPGEGTPFRLCFVPTDEPKTELNRAHFDLTSASLEEQQRTVAKALALGARPLDVGQGPDAEHVVLADPEGNEFCVIEPGNSFLAGCGVVGALACDGSREAGYFWSAALGWPLVWDQDEETAIQSPHGGSKISWGGTPPAPGTGRDRVRFDLAAEDDQEVDRLLSLGARRTGTTGPGCVDLADPDGTRFRVLAPR